MFWQDSGKTARAIARRKRIVNIMGKARGWQFVRYVEFIEGWGFCEVTNAKIKKGIEVSHPEVDRHFIVAEAVAIKYVDDVVIPRQTELNTADSLPNKRLDKEKKPPQKRGPKPKVKGSLKPEPGIPDEFAIDMSRYSWSHKK